MKPEFESVKTSDNASFTVRKFKEKKFSAPYHFHPECELTLILKGSGKRYVGDTMQNLFLSLRSMIPEKFVCGTTHFH
jgi:hypothetical protein